MHIVACSMHDGVAWDVTGCLEGDWDHTCWIDVLVLLHYMACICNRVCFPPATPPHSFPPLDLKMAACSRCYDPAACPRSS